MFSKLLAAVLGLFLALGLASSASAYPVAPPDASVSNPVVEPGQGFTFFAEGFRPGSTVTVTVTLQGGEAAGSLDVVASGGSRLGAGFVVVRAAADVLTFTRVADAQGRISLPLDLAATGTYSIVATGINPAGEPFSVTSEVQVVADGSDDSDGSGSGSDDSGAGSNGSSAGGSSAATLARTGVDNAATIAWAAFGVLVLGGLLVAVASGRGRTRESV